MSGWSSQVIIANQVVVQGANDGIWIYAGTPATGNLIVSLAAGAGTDPYGNNYPQGVNVTTGVVSGTTITGGIVQTAAAGARIALSGNMLTVYDAGGGIIGQWDPAGQKLTIYQTGTSQHAYVQIQAQPSTPQIIFQPDSTQCISGVVSGAVTGAPLIPQLNLSSPKMSGPPTGRAAFLSLYGSDVSGATKADARFTTDYTAIGGSPANSTGPWTPLAFNAGFQTAAVLANGLDPAWRYVSSSQVELRGQWQPSPAGPITSGAVPITLPAGLWPVGSYYFATATSNTASTVNGRTRIGTAGAIQFNFVGATPPVWASLDGIAFDLV